RRGDSRAARPEHVCAADAGQACTHDRDARGRAGGAYAPRAEAGDKCTGRARLDEQAATGQAALFVLLALELAAACERGGALLPLAGNLVDGQLAALGLGVGCEQLPEAACNGRIRHGTRT